MTTSHVGKVASKAETTEMLNILEKVGKNLQTKELEDLFGKIPKVLRNDKEKVIRFLLLTAFLDQQAKSPTARSTAVKIFKPSTFWMPCAFNSSSTGSPTPVWSTNTLRNLNFITRYRIKL